MNPSCTSSKEPAAFHTACIDAFWVGVSLHAASKYFRPFLNKTFVGEMYVQLKIKRLLLARLVYSCQGFVVYLWTFRAAVEEGTAKGRNIVDSARTFGRQMSTAFVFLRCRHQRRNTKHLSVLGDERPRRREQIALCPSEWIGASGSQSV
jgi:hypothetical protein